MMEKNLKNLWILLPIVNDHIAKHATFSKKSIIKDFRFSKVQVKNHLAQTMDPIVLYTHAKN